MKKDNIELNINNNTKTNVDISLIEKNINTILHKNNISGKLEIGICFVKPNNIKNINKKFRKINKTTDVLSFPTNELINTNLPINNLGDIIICPQYAQKKIKEKLSDNWNKISKTEQTKLINKEIIFLINHGLLHLIGIHHK